MWLVANTMQRLIYIVINHLNTARQVIKSVLKIISKIIRRLCPCISFPVIWGWPGKMELVLTLKRCLVPCSLGYRSASWHMCQWMYKILDKSSYNPTSHKETTIKTLTGQAQLVCDTWNSLRDKNKYLRCVFHKKNYNVDLIKRNS